MHREAHVLFVLRPPVENYPPTLNQIAILVERGFRVSVVCAPADELYAAAGALPEAIQRVSVASVGRRGGLPGRVFGVVRFAQAVRREVRRMAPDILVTCDAEAAWAAGGGYGRRRHRLVWHFHELPERQDQGISVNLANRWVWRHARQPDLIVFPDPGRAGVFAADAGIDPAAIPIVANCPRPVQELPEPSLRELLGGSLPRCARAVLYHGPIGPDHGIETAVLSMRFWPKEACLVLKGKPVPGYVERIRGLAEAESVSGRVLVYWPGFQSYEDHYRFIAGADLGWTVLAAISRNWEYSAYASNKRFECMALGVPQITNTGPLLEPLIVETGCGVCVPADDAAAAGKAVARLLAEPERLRAMRKAGCELHLSRFNYDVQFEPVLERFKQWIGCGPK